MGRKGDRDGKIGMVYISRVKILILKKPIKKPKKPLRFLEKMIFMNESKKMYLFFEKTYKKSFKT